jgi:small nuclear ribonucleoprotein (snRNP)-like protein
MINVQDLLGKKLKIEVIDGRTLIGIFISLDRDGNIILSETVSIVLNFKRFIGCVLITSLHIKKVYMFHENLLS